MPSNSKELITQTQSKLREDIIVPTKRKRNSGKLFYRIINVHRSKIILKGIRLKRKYCKTILIFFVLSSC